MLIYKILKNIVKCIFKSHLKYFYYFWFFLALLPYFLTNNKEFYMYYIAGFPKLIYLSIIPGLIIILFRMQFLNVKDISPSYTIITKPSVLNFYFLFFLFGFTHFLLLVFPYFLLFLLFSLINYSKFTLILLSLYSALNTFAYGLFLYIFTLSGIVIANKKIIPTITWMCLLTFIIVITIGGIVSFLEKDFSYMGLRNNIFLFNVDNLAVENFAFYYEKLIRFSIEKNTITCKFIFTFFSYLILSFLILLIDFIFFYKNFNLYYRHTQKQIELDG